MKHIILAHELSPAGQHRIVEINLDGSNRTGRWAEQHALACLDDLRASTGAISGLPIGIFKAQVKAHQTFTGVESAT